MPIPDHTGDYGKTACCFAITCQRQATWIHRNTIVCRGYWPITAIRADLHRWDISSQSRGERTIEIYFFQVSYSPKKNGIPLWQIVDANLLLEQAVSAIPTRSHSGSV